MKEHGVGEFMHVVLTLNLVRGYELLIGYKPSQLLPERRYRHVPGDMIQISRIYQVRDISSDDPGRES